MAIDADGLVHPLHACGARAMPHDRDQHHDGGAVDVAA
jgi:hypothetical protein